MNDSLIESAVLELQSGDSDAFQTLYENTSAYVYTVALRMLGQRVEAEEAMQEVYITVFRKIKSFRHDSAFRTWLYRIVMRECLDRLRRCQGSEEIIWSESVVDAAGQLKTRVADQPEIFGTELRLCVEDALQSIHPELRSTFVLRDIEGLSYSEISFVLGCSTGTVSSRLARARKQVAAHLIAIGIDETYFE